MSIRTSDPNWVRGIFGFSPTARDRRDNSKRTTTHSNYKFGDTSVGGNQAINPPPQFTRFADPKTAGLLADFDLGDSASSMFVNEDNSGSFRMGRTFSEVHDDNAHYIHMRFGMAKPTGMFNFFANMHDRDLAKLATTGEHTSKMRRFGQVAGAVGLFMVLPSVVFFPLIISSAVLKLASAKAPSKFFYLNPTQNLYLRAVQSILDTQLLHHRLVPMWNVVGTDRYTDVSNDENVLNATMQEVYSELPDIWKSNGKFDVFKMINRYQVLANYQHQIIQSIYSKSANEVDYLAAINAYVESAKNESILQNAYEQTADLQAISKAYASSILYQESEEDAAAHDAKMGDLYDKMNAEAGISAEGIVSQSGTDEDPLKVKDVSTFDKFWNGLSDVTEQLGSEAMDGSMWITLQVDGKESLTDTISSSVTEPTIASSLNAISSKARAINASTAGGKTGFDFVDGVIGGVKDFIGGALDTLHISGLSAVFGRSNVVIPDIWESTDTQIASQSFKVPLRSPHGNDLALFQNIMVPMSFILAGALPLSTGKQSFTSPFLVELYSRGRNTIRLGIIESVTITRGAGNKGWRSDGRMLGCDIEFTVKDLSKVLHMPILQDPGIFDDDNVYTDYMATIGAASLREMTYDLDQFALNVNKWKQSWKSRFMTGRITNDLTNVGIFEAVRAVSRGTTR